ncbi:FixH family protein [Sulfurimonas sp. SAG-AH-194-L11]|nr:FixH family protein [Sulfurimonas sp. SAG-AH-194-L11]MDF1877953.1 FixH family protein [Sulfurimonas sp. SAG-AH-194-L11]
MKILTTILLTLILGASLAQASAFSKDAKYRTTQVHITAQKPITSGSNVLQFSITKEHKPLVNSKVTIKAFMPAMPGMPAMVSKVVAKELGNGLYEAKLNLAMSGTWQVHIFITPKEGKKSRVKTTINF